MYKTYQNSKLIRKIINKNQYSNPNTESVFYLQKQSRKSSFIMDTQVLYLLIPNNKCSLTVQHPLLTLRFLEKEFWSLPPIRSLSAMLVTSILRIGRVPRKSTLLILILLKRTSRTWPSVSILRRTWWTIGQRRSSLRLSVSRSPI